MSMHELPIRNRANVSKGYPSVGDAVHHGSFGRDCMRSSLRCLLLSVFLGLAYILAAISKTNGTLKWIFTDGYFPMIGCPSQFLLTGYYGDVTGPYCKVLYTFQDSSAIVGEYNGTPTSVLQNSVHGGLFIGEAVYVGACDLIESGINQLCLFNAWDTLYPFLDTSVGETCLFNVAPVCDSTGEVYVGDVLNLMGVLVAIVYVCAVYFFAVLYHAYRKRMLMTMADNTVPKAELVRSVNAMTRMVDSLWSVASTNHSANSTKMSTPENSFLDELDCATPTDQKSYHAGFVSPGLLFQSESWMRRVNKSVGMRAKLKRLAVLRRHKIFTQTLLFVVYFAIVTGLMVGTLFALPSIYSTSTVHSFISVIIFESQLLPQAFNSPAVWLDFITLLDITIELLFLIVSASVVVQWPNLPVKVPHIIKIRSMIKKGQEIDIDQATNDGAVYTDTVCAVVLCSLACSSERKKHLFIKRMKNILTMFPPESIFVVDYSPGHNNPPDNTWETCFNEISPLVQYCFVPDSDSRLFALYWFNSVWLPFLIGINRSPFYSHILLVTGFTGVDSQATMSVLPNMPMDLILPIDNFIVHSESLRGSHIPLTIDKNQNSTYACMQDILFKHDALSRAAENKIATCSEMDGRICVFEREALQKLLKNNTAGNPTALALGVSIVKLRSTNHVSTIPYFSVQVPVPDGMAPHIYSNIQAAQGGKAGSNFFVAMIELCSVFSLCNVYSLSIKPRLGLEIVVGGLVQIVRPFVLGSLIFKDPLSIVFLAISAAVIMYLELIVLLFVYSSRPDLRQKITAGAIILYPWFRGFVTWIVDIGAFYNFLLFGFVNQCYLQPHKRAHKLKDVPPCPPHHIVNWYTIWGSMRDTPQCNGVANKSIRMEDRITDSDLSISSSGSSESRHT